ncbi:MAG: DUF58 domain-containing protein [Mariprofundaceae bacterium]|nr:DUF58 domain-containing protein [Mariprofundaceae bacterium]
MNADAVSISLSGLTALQQQVRLLRLRPLQQAAHLAGAHRSRLRGRGMEFDEVRVYQPGDAISSIDWKVTARKNTPHIKLFREERERPLLLCLDYRPSMLFATRGRLKAVQASHMAALLAWAGIGKGDRLGGLIFSATGHEEMRPARGRKAVLHWLHRCCHAPVWSQGRDQHAPADALQQSLLRLRRLARPGTTVVFLSDFRGLDASCRQQLLSLARHCQCLLCCLYDPLEKHLPASNQYRIHDGSTHFVMDASDLRLQAQVLQGFEQRQACLQQLCQHENLHLLPLATDDSPLDVLKSSGWWSQ